VRRLLVAVSGLVAGLAAGMVMLLFNPLALPARSPNEAADLLIVKQYAYPVYRGLDFSAGAFLGRSPEHGRNTVFQEPAIRNIRASIMVLPADNRSGAALGVKLSSLSADNSVLGGRLAADSYWSIIWPGQGSYFLVGHENYWKLLRDRLLGIVDPAVPDYAVSVPPAFIAGVSGRFSGVSGTYDETLRPAAGPPAAWSGVVRIRPVPPGPGP